MHHDAQRLRDGILAGDTMALIEATELCNLLACDDDGDQPDDSISRAGLDDISLAISILIDGDDCDDDTAIVLAAMYRLHGGREVRWTPDGLFVLPAMSPAT